MKKHSSDPPALLSNRFSKSIKSLSKPNLRRWLHQSYQALTDGCSYVVTYGPRIYRFLHGAKYDEKEERALKNQLTVGYDAARRTAIGDSPQKGSQDVALRWIRPRPKFSVAINRTAAQKTEDAAARVGLRLDEVPYPALWLEGLVRSTEELPSLPSPSDVVSWSRGYPPFSWWARFWKWYWRRVTSWTWMIIIFTVIALWLRFWKGAEVGQCLAFVFYMMVICYLCSIHAWVLAVCEFFLD